MSAKDQIKQIVDYFKREPQLKDKTDGMAEGLLLGAQLADDANELSKETDASFKALQREYTENGNGSQTTAEITVARDGELVLDDRLKRDFGNVNAQLAQTAKLLNVNAFGVTGDGVTDDTQSIQLAFDYAVAENFNSVYFPEGDFLISSPINTKGISIIGAGMRLSKIKAKTDTNRMDWLVPESTHPNDVSMLYAWNKNNWTAHDITIDAQDQYAGGLNAFGGSNIHFYRVHGKNSANAILQFMGGRLADSLPIRNSSMTHCVSENSRWNFILDGNIYDTQVTNNISVNAVNRHISCDPGHNELATEQRGILVADNILTGRRNVPTAWKNDGTTTPDMAIGTRTGFYGTIKSNVIRNWRNIKDAEGSHVLGLRGIGVRGMGGLVSTNYIVVDEGDTSTGIYVEGALPDTIIDDNTIINTDDGITLDTSERLLVKNNKIKVTTGQHIRGLDTLGSSTRTVENYNMNTQKFIDGKGIWESGKDGNKEWVLFDDGSARTIVRNIPMKTDRAAGAIFRSGATSVWSPKTLVGDVTVTASASSNLAWANVYNGGNQSSVVLLGAETGISANVDLVFHGRWK